MFEVSQNFSKTNRKAAANVREAAQRMQEQEKTLQRVARLTETGQDILADTERALRNSKRAAARQREHPNAEHRYADSRSDRRSARFHPHRQAFRPAQTRS